LKRWVTPGPAVPHTTAGLPVKYPGGKLVGVRMRLLVRLGSGALLRGDGGEGRPALFYFATTAVRAWGLSRVMLRDGQNLQKCFLAGVAEELIVGHTNPPHRFARIVPLPRSFARPTPHLHSKNWAGPCRPGVAPRNRRFFLVQSSRMSPKSWFQERSIISMSRCSTGPSRRA
jgi:hypothetical protein